MLVSHPLLARRPARAAPTLTLAPQLGDLQLVQGRLHECCGPARRSFAVWLAAQTDGPVFWIATPWTQELLNAEGLCEWMDPARLIFVSPKRPEDMLWTMEEVLRAGVAALCVADLPNLPGLTSVRRMHLAAETSGAQTGRLPTGLVLTPGQGGAPGVETRWHLAPGHKADRDIWQVQRLRARTAPFKSWDIERPAPSHPLRIKTS